MASRPDHGWAWVVLVAGFFCNVTFDGIIFSFGMFYLELLSYFEQGRGVTSWVGSVISGVYAVVGPLASVLVNKYGCRSVTIGGALLSCTAFILSTFSPNIEVMIITYGVMGGTGFGLMYLSSYVMVGHYFDKHRALATGLMSCGSGVGTFIFAPLSIALLHTYNWKGSMWIITGFVLNGVVCGATFRPMENNKIQKNEEEENKKLMDWSLLRNPSFITFSFSSFLCMLGFFVPFIYLPDFVQKQGINQSEGAILVSIIGVTNTIGRVICGWLSDKPWADALKIYNSALILGGTVTACCSLISNIYLLYVYAAIFGVCVAAYVSLCAIILIEFLGLEKLSNSFGFLNMFRGIATFIGAPVAGFLYDCTGDYELAFIVAGAAICSAGVICLPLRVFRKCAGAREALKHHGYDKERALTLTNEELETLAKDMLKDKHNMFNDDMNNTADKLKEAEEDKDMIKSSFSIHSVISGPTDYFASLHSIHSFKNS